jgi:hypothetical protein
MLSNPHRRPITAVIQRSCARAALAVLFTLSVSPAQASPIPNQPTPSTSAGSCPLARVGTQFVRCDNLTGAGVRAPQWIPELASVPATQEIDHC